MTATRYLIRSLLHYRFAYFGVLAGAALGALTLLGALFAGDSVEASLRQIGAKRIGRATHLLSSGDRFFREALADDLAAASNSTTGDDNVPPTPIQSAEKETHPAGSPAVGVRAAPLIYARGTAANPTSRALANQVQLIGVTDAFWTFAPERTTITLDAATSSIAVNETLAQRLGIAIGDTLIVRLQKPGILAGNAPLAGAESTLQSLRCTVAAVVGDASFGRFGLDATQVPQPSVFLPIRLLQDTLKAPDQANLLLIEADRSTADLDRALSRVVRLADYGLSLKWIESASAFEVASNRILIDPELNQAMLRAIPGARSVLSYLVNAFQSRERSTPYSIATATTGEAAPFLPPNLGARDIVINAWLAEDLRAKVGDDVRLAYYQVDAAGALIERNATFRVHSVIPLEGPAADDAWMPDFPGVSDTKSPKDWDPGLPLNLDLIRDQDERYWDTYRGAPKAFLSLAAGQELWSTRWGNATALRIPFARERERELAETLLGALRPEMNQLILRDLRSNSGGGAMASVDFGGLFIGMSFFLIVATLGLVAMLFQFCLLQRNREDALLSAVGLSHGRLLRWRLSEGLALLLAGCLIGLPLAALYTRGILTFLDSIWAGQSSMATFVFAAKPESIAIGIAVFVVFSLLGIWLAIRKLTRRALSVRLAAQAEEITPSAKIRRSSLVMAGLALAVSAGAIGYSNRGLPAQGAFYLAGFSLLAAGIASCRWWMARTPDQDHAGELDASELGKRNLKARRSRSLTVVGLIATAVFMVLSVASFRKHVGDDWLERESGTGGFAFLIETSITLNPARDSQSRGFEIFDAHASELGEIVPLRVGAGDNVNCFNLTTSSQPQLLAVDCAKLAARNAFLVKMPPRPSSSTGWSALRALGRNGALPALVDETTLMWALKRKVGDVLTYTDENGKPIEVEIVGALPDSIFQGYVIVDEQRFLERFPSHPGHSMFLADAVRETNVATLGAVANRLESTMRDVGGRVTLTRGVLAAFHQIENTYIAIFNVLGSLGVVLGSLGLAVVVARNLRERQGEFTVMMAMGIPRGVLARMIVSEFGWLVLWGIGIGALASAIAVWPSLATFPAAPTLALVAGLLAGIVIVNIASGWLIFRWSLRSLGPSFQQTPG